MNSRIRAETVRLINEKGEMVGVFPLSTSMQMAREAELDLVEVAPSASPPVCRIMDFGKYKYELKKRTTEARKKAHQIKTKEIRLRPKTDEHDVMTKLQHAREFLAHHHKVLVNMMFRGREMQHMDIGQALMARFTAGLEDVAKVEQPARMEGRRMTLVLAPK